MAYTHAYRPSNQALPILAIALLAVVGTAFLLVCYYVIFHRCVNGQQRHLPRQSITREDEDSFIDLSPEMQNRGLNQSAIRKIPTFVYRIGKDKSIWACVVCLNEFQEKDVLRRLPNCSHAFHLDCIDVWLQGNANCPLCRTNISGSTKYPRDSNIVAPTSSPQDLQPYSNSFVAGDADFVVIELGGPSEEVFVSNRLQESESSRQVQDQLRTPKVMEQRPRKLKSSEKHRHFPTMGDEFIDLREKDDQFGIQPIRRSFSFDSAVNQQLYLGVQRAIQQNLHHREISRSEESSNRSQNQRPFLTFVHGRGSRRVVPSS